MGYLIRYEPELDHKYRIKEKWKPGKGFVPWCCVFAVTAALAMIPGVRQWILEFLIPGESDVTVSAFSQFVSDIRSGDQLSDALTCFCREILTHG